MINFIRILTIIIASIVTVTSIFYIDTNEELKKAHIAYRSGDMDQTLRMARRAGTLSSVQAEKTDALLLQARAAEKMGWFKKALDYLNQLLETDNDNVLALLIRGKLENKLVEHQKALKDLNRAFNSGKKISDKTTAKYLTQRGIANLALKKVNDAEKDAHKAIEINKKLPEAHDLLSRIYENKGMLKEALKECDQAYQLSLERDRLFFTNPEGRKLSDRLVDLKVKNLQLE